MSRELDVVVVGAGIVGLATARALLESNPAITLTVLEKEDAPASHQTGRNSGVIHAGLYYLPGSLKARLCFEGGRRLVRYCEGRGIPTTRAGKLVVATEPAQLAALDELGRRARANGVETRRVGPDEIREIEPDAAGIGALHVPFTGSVDFARVAEALAADVLDGGGRLLTGARVVAARRHGTSSVRRLLVTTAGDVPADLVVNCAGLHVDRVARLLGHDPGVRILPFRGEYRALRDDSTIAIGGHLYPVPDPRFPHLGVHFSRSVTGRVEIGPNAVWAWGREAYGRFDIHPRDAVETLTWAGFLNLARAHWRTGVAEQWRALADRAFVREARRLVPRLTVEDLGIRRSGVRAQAVRPDGSLVHDFMVLERHGAVHVINAPSPAATSCLAIGEHIAGRALVCARPV
ncbi:MAG: L-2-hydroxyglutarate oxidase [Gemmatimonadota bacterium]|nr:L-2-hydroxyglutarate oxidase [Gemmatimonadota bacterium]